MPMRTMHRVNGLMFQDLLRYEKKAREMTDQKDGSAQWDAGEHEGCGKDSARAFAEFQAEGLAQWCPGCSQHVQEPCHHFHCPAKEKFASAQCAKRPDTDQIMAVLRKVTTGHLYRDLTCERWKDGIDITVPTYAAERLAEEFAAIGALTPAASERPPYEELRQTNVELMAKLREARDQVESAAAIRNAAERVCWFDWSDNDRDAAAAIEELRRSLTSTVRGSDAQT